MLNAKEHAREAEIIKDAGQIGAVTIATNMAGRGVDIKIDDQVRELGGLYVLGTERHESRRIDNQLRGRSGRQGDPGETRFYLSGQDDLVRLFAGDRIYNIMERFKLPDDQPMEAKILSNQIENAQKKVEEQNFVAAQERPQVRRRDERPAQGDLRAAPRRARGRRPLRGDQGAVAARGDRGHVVRVHSRTTRWTTGISTRSSPGWTRSTAPASPPRSSKGLDRDAIVAEFLDDAVEAYGERERRSRASAKA